MDTVFRAGAASAIEKLAEKDSDEGAWGTAKGVGAVGAGGALLAGSRHRLLGTKRVYHGTTADRLKGIMAKGLDPKFGGSGAATHAAASAFGGEAAKRFQRHSKGKVHVTGSKAIAKRFARFSGHRSGQRGKVLSLNMDYDKYKRMVHDPDMLGDPKQIPKFIQKYIGSRGTEKISPHEIKGSGIKLTEKARRRLSKLPGYIKNNPGRFGLGVLGAGAGAYLAQKGARKLIAKARQRDK